MMRPNQSILALSALLLTVVSCTETVSVPKEGLPTQISVSAGKPSVFVQTQNAKSPFLSTRISKLPNNGPNSGVPVIVELRGPDRPDSSAALLLAPNNVDLIDRVVNDFGPQLPESIAFEAGKMIAAQSVCYDQQISRNSFGRSFSNPEDIAKIVPRGANPLGIKVPDGARGELIPRAEYRFEMWRVNLWCR